MCKYCVNVDGSICYFKFPKVVLAHILGKVDTFAVFLNGSSRTCLPIFIEIGLYLTDREQKISWHVFKTRCIIIIVIIHVYFRP